MRSIVAVAVAIALLAVVASAQADPSEYGIKAVSASSSDDQAGAHPDFTLSFELNREPGGELPATTRDISIDLPPGLLGNPNAVPKCSAAQLVTTDVPDKTNSSGCPQDSQVGISEVLLFNNGNPLPLTEPIYNMESPGGDIVARFGFIADVYPVFINARLRSESDYGITVDVEGAGSLIPLLSASTTIWGVPADESHDTQRITPYEAYYCSGVPCNAPGGTRRPSGLVPSPFMINPTRCGVPRTVKVTARSYARPDEPVSKTASLPPITGCGQLGFAPKLGAKATTRETASPSGLDVEVDLPQDETVKGLATSELRDTVVTFPKGVTIASGAADGLAACSASDAGYASRQPAHCPDAAKLGTVEVDVPALAHPLQGALYQRTPEPGNLFRVWLIADEQGAHIVLPGDLQLDNESGQITSLFLEIPQAPVRAIDVHVFGGPRGPLSTPLACGTYFTLYEFTPWSSNAPVAGDAPMSFDRNCNTGGFEPRLSVGSSKPIAGTFSAFVTAITRQSSEQNIAGVDIKLPRGVAGKLAGVTLCEGQEAQVGNCPPASKVGTATVAAGPGSSPLWLPQPGKEPIVFYLSGPYKGAPYGLVVVAPAQAGPFDLGLVVIRGGIYVDPNTAQATVKFDPLPQLLEGVPVSYRTIHADIDRPRFALNPTNCHAKEAIAHLVSDRGAVASPASRFQVGGCLSLPFKPRLALHLHGKTNRGAHPGLQAVLRARPGDANIARAQVALPHSEFLEQGHIRTICTRVQFAADECPQGAIYGYARAFTPLLDQPLEGPVYLRSSSHELPDLVVALDGQVEFNLVGRIDSIRGGIRSTFENIPDAPVSKFVLTMRGGKKGLLVNSRQLCQSPARARVEFDGQNGKKIKQSPLLQSGCKQHKAHRGPDG